MEPLLTRNHHRPHLLTRSVQQALKFFKSLKLKWQTAVILKRHISTTVQPISIKIGMVKQIAPRTLPKIKN